MKKSLHPVSDNALLRYMERVLDIDVETLRRELGHKVDLACGDHRGLSAVVIEGVRFLLSEEGVVVTATHQNLPRRGRRGRK
jgi:hypothetical protein